MNETPSVSRTFRKTAAAALLSLLIVSSESHGETAQYEVTFDSVWSSETHPYEFPPNPHFSGLIGGTHQDTVSFWEVGGIATDGIEAMAETGATGGLRAEVMAAIDEGHAEFVIQGPGIGSSPNTVSHRFEISDDYPFVTLVSMIAPSPDWFVGTSGLNLRPGGAWLGRVVYDLLPYDAGTDSGLKYTSPNEDTSPAEPIAQLTALPFDKPTPLGTFTFLRILDSDFNQNGMYDASDIDNLTEAVRNNRTETSYDVNKDGQVNAGDRLAWLDNAGIRPGDADFNGRFDSGDLVTIFQAGEYQDAIEGNSGWSEGDFDGNGESNSSDLVLALQSGNYQVGASGAIPEPTTATLFLVSLLMLVPFGKRSWSLNGRD